jgi:hypothetical protein
MSMRNNAKQGRNLPISQNHSVVIVVLVLLTLPADGSGATKTIDVLSPCVCVVPEGTYTESLSQVDEYRAQVEAYHVDLWYAISTKSERKRMMDDVPYSPIGISYVKVSLTGMPLTRGYRVSVR